MEKVLQQMGLDGGRLLRAGLPDSVSVEDTAPGPEGWRPDATVLLAAPSKAWRGRTAPAGWPGRLRWVQLAGAGLDGYPDWLFEVEHVSTAAGLNAPAIAEFVLSLMLAAEKRLPDVWMTEPPQPQQGPIRLGSLRGRTLGLAGLGAIGSTLAGHARMMGMRVVGIRKDIGRSVEGVELVPDVLQLARVADHLVACMPLTSATRGMFNREFFEASKPGMHFVNVARGELLDQAALIDALDRGTVSLASLDVTDPEPLPAGHTLYSHPRVRLSPHIAWSSPNALVDLIEFFVLQHGAYRNGRRLMNLQNTY